MSEANSTIDSITPRERDRRVLELYEQVLEIEQRLIPTGLHVFGRVPEEAERVDVLWLRRIH